MNLFGLSPGELLLILMVAMVVLGPEKLPETAASLGKWIREFRVATQELTQQFTADNPLLEIQRALTLDPATFTTTAATAAATALKEQTPSGAPASTTTGATSETLVPQASVGSVARGGPGAARASVRTSYFDTPSFRAGIADPWTHSSLTGAGRQVSALIAVPASPIDSSWTHGVPVPRLADDQSAMAGAWNDEIGNSEPEYCDDSEAPEVSSGVDSIQPGADAVEPVAVGELVENSTEARTA